MKHLPIDTYEQFRQWLEQRMMVVQRTVQVVERDGDKLRIEREYTRRDTFWEVYNWLEKHAPDTTDDTA